jgi:hypothetical protein
MPIHFPLLICDHPVHLRLVFFKLAVLSPNMGTLPGLAWMEMQSDPVVRPIVRNCLRHSRPSFSGSENHADMCWPLGMDLDDGAVSVTRETEP